MNVQRLAAVGALLCSTSAIVLSACTHEPTKPDTATVPATVVILGNKTAPVHCTCDAAEREAVKWKAYAEKLEKQLGIEPGRGP